MRTEAERDKDEVARIRTIKRLSVLTTASHELKYIRSEIYEISEREESIFLQDYECDPGDKSLVSMLDDTAAVVDDCLKHSATVVKMLEELKQYLGSKLRER